MNVVELQASELLNQLQQQMAACLLNQYVTS